DKEDRLVFVNSKNRDVFEGVEHLMRSGTTFEDIVRETFTSGSQPVPEEQIEEYTQRRMELHRNNYGRREVCMRDDIWVEISEHLTPEGNVVVSWADLTLQKRRQQALSSLLSDSSNSLSVQERAAKA